MRSRDFLMAAGAAPAALLAGCTGKKPSATQPAEPKPAATKPAEVEPAAAKPAPAKKPGTVVLCYKCGQIKGSDTCCAADAEKCSKCGLAKGSPGCCKINTVPKAPTTGSDAKAPASGSGVK